MKNNNKKKHVQPLNEAQRRLVEKHIAYAMNLGIRFREAGLAKGISCEDLQQESCIGLCVAARKYDAEKSANFQTYMHYWCVRYIKRAIKHEGCAIDEDVECIPDSIADNEDEAQKEKEARVASLIKVLNQQEKKVICLIYALPYCKDVICNEHKDFIEVAEIMNLKSARVHQIYDKAMTKMERGTVQ